MRATISSALKVKLPCTTINTKQHGQHRRRYSQCKGETEPHCGEEGNEGHNQLSTDCEVALQYSKGGIREGKQGMPLSGRMPKVGPHV
jgi:hypothetical protein